MSTDLMERLSAVGDLNDEWSEPQLSEGRPPLYVTAAHEATPPSRHRYAIPAAVAALALVAVAATSMIANDDNDTVAETNAATEADTGTGTGTESSPPPQELSSLVPSDWPATHPDPLTGVTTNGLTWSVVVEAGTWEVCYQLGAHTGCGPAQGHPVQISEGSGGDSLVFGVVMPGMSDSEGATITGPADRVEFQLSDRSWVDAEHVSDRLWVGFVPSTTTLRGALIYHWGDTNMWLSNEPDDLDHPDEVEAPLTEADRQAAEAQARRGAERARQAQVERDRQAELHRDD